jgi:hypothetical protein
MNKKLLAIAAVLGLLSGCAKLDPRLDNKIDNQNGKIDEIRNNQNGIMMDVGKLKQDQQIQNSQLKEVQNGYLNLNNKMFNRENNGVQIFQGDGALILVFGLGVIALVFWHYRSTAKRHQKAAEIMAQQIAMHEDEELNDRVFRAVSNTEVESTVYKMVKKYQRQP